MSNQIIVPSLGESVTEATVSKWLKQVGENVDTDEPLVELETDKVNVEVPSPLSGTLSSIKVKEGDTVEVGALLGIINEGKSSSREVKQSKISNQSQEDFTPPKSVNKKKEIKKISPKKAETLILNEQKQDKNLNEALVLDTLASTETTEIREDISFNKAEPK